MRRLRDVAASSRGFTLIEIVVVATLIVVGAAMAVPITQNMVDRAKNDSALAVTTAFVDAARDRAVAERRNIEISYVAPDMLYAHRVEVPSGPPPYGKPPSGEARLAS